MLVLMRTNLTAIAHFSTMCTSLKWRLYVRSRPKIIYVHIYNYMTTETWWNVIHRLSLNGRSRANKLFFARFLKFLLTF